MSDAELVVLGLLQEGAEYAYEIDQRIEERRLREWAAIGFSSVYYQLHRAKKAGWVQSRLKPGQRGPRTRRYQLTDEGRAALCSAVCERLQASAAPARVELTVMFAGVLPPDKFRAALLEYATQNRQAAQEARARWAQLPDTPYRVYQDAIFDHSIGALEAEAAWAERTAQRLESMPNWDASSEEADTS